MVTLRDSLLSSSARRVSLRMRPDLSATRHHYLGRSYWIVKDPIGLNYYRFQDEEYAILSCLDGDISLDEVKDRFETEFPPQKLTLDELQQFLGMLHRSGLVIAAVGGQGKQLLNRRRERKQKEFLSALANILCLRFKGFDPEKFLSRLYPFVAWFYTRIAFICCIALGISALTLVTVQFREVTARLPAFHEFFSFKNALLLSATLGVIKVLHEFGHGMTCKHFGGECHEMGVMVLVLTPCLYCNVSDSWMLPNKWHRAAIGAGGMYVELVLASLATWIWRYTEPGLLNHICLNTMFVCSVSTLMFNANPLLRYDGYYILADLTEIPNLRQKATSILNRKMSEWFLGMEQPEDPFLPQRNQMFFVFYSIAAAIYRWVVVFSILFFLYKVFQPYRLEKIGQLLALASLWGLFITPLYQLGKFFSVPGRFEQVKKTRMFASIGGAIAVVVVVLSIPLPHSVFAPFEIQPHGADPVYVNVAEGGVLVERLAYPGEKVTKGQLLARLESKDVDIEISKLMAKKDEYTTQLSNLRRKSDYDRNAPEQIPELQKQIEGVERQLAEKKADKQRLEIVAPCDGYVIPAPVTPREQHNDDEESQLPFWSGTPLDKENYRPYLKEGTLICQIGNPKDLEAVLVIEQGDMELVAPHQKVDIKLDALPHDTLQGTVDAVSEYNLRITPRRLTAKAGGDVASTTDPHTGAEHPQDSSYQARVAVVDTEGVIIPGQRGHAKIHTRPMSLGERLWLLIMRTFNFRLAA